VRSTIRPHRDESCRTTSAKRATSGMVRAAT
jgi:hypothetical protein